MGIRWEPQKINHLHEQMMDWMLANPQRPLKEMAPVFNVSVPFIYMLVNSALFQQELNRRHAELWGEIRVELKDKLQAAAHASLDKVLDALQAPECTSDFALSAMDKVTSKLGYGPARGAAGGQAPAPPVQVNVTINRGLLAQARAAMEAPRAAPASALEHDRGPCPREPEPVQSVGRGPVPVPVPVRGNL